jgi:hypothetical protein
MVFSWTTRMLCAGRAKLGIFWKSGSQGTPRWREQDSNPRSLSRIGPLPASVAERHRYAACLNRACPMSTRPRSPGAGGPNHICGSRSWPAATLAIHSSSSAAKSHRSTAAAARSLSTSPSARARALIMTEISYSAHHKELLRSPELERCDVWLISGRQSAPSIHSDAVLLIEDFLTGPDGACRINRGDLYGKSRIIRFPHRIADIAQERAGAASHRCPSGFFRRGGGRF